MLKQSGNPNSSGSKSKTRQGDIRSIGNPSPVSYSNHPSCPACQEFMSQLCKTKPIS